MKAITTGAAAEEATIISAANVSKSYRSQGIRKRPANQWEFMWD